MENNKMRFGSEEKGKFNREASLAQAIPRRGLCRSQAAGGSGTDQPWRKCQGEMVRMVKGVQKGVIHMGLWWAPSAPSPSPCPPSRSILGLRLHPGPRRPPGPHPSAGDVSLQAEGDFQRRSSWLPEATQTFPRSCTRSARKGWPLDGQGTRASEADPGGFLDQRRRDGSFWKCFPN